MLFARRPMAVKYTKFAKPFVTKSDENAQLLAVHYCRLLQRLRSQPGAFLNALSTYSLFWVVPVRVCELNYGFASASLLVW